MYLGYFKLKELPYKISPDPRYIYMTPQHEDALQACQLTVQEHGGLIAVYGEVGMGKTTIARRLYQLLDDESINKVGLIYNPALTVNAFLQAIMQEFDVPPKRSFAKSLEAFEDYLLSSYEAGKNNIIIIDEAQKLNRRLMMVIHTLLNFESSTDKFLQIVLIGQNELADNIDKIREIKSRVARFADLQNLSEDDTKEMIGFRWHTASAGKSAHPFSDKALRAIYMFAKGIPRDINKLCHESLLTAFTTDSAEVTPDMIVDAARTMRLTREDA